MKQKKRYHGEPISDRRKERAEARRSISKTTRFEVFKRDSFTCQYCGRKAPDIVLQVDHIEPIALGGNNTLLNYTTSCVDCNLGKGARLLSDNSILAQQRRQLDELAERREQFDMMLRWQKSLAQLDDEILNRLAAYWAELADGWFLTESGKIKLKRLLKRFQVEEVMVAMRTSIDQYVEHDSEGKATKASIELAF